jgi:Fe-S-cluster-containing dehydrogenase component/Ni/Fe-hydrogenase subunit HybB-like protein
MPDLIWKSGSVSLNQTQDHPQVPDFRSRTVMGYGFIIDHRRCIGCHACTTACKSENEVPLGVFRTWVKYVEKGAFPDTRRYFTVLRCNHCDNPPCVHICPTRALFKRRDGIVDFDNRHCISCRSCMVACPYDAIYIDPATQTAAKCHYCAHRTEVGLQPACVVVCPEQAIVAGDLDNQQQEIFALRQSEQLWSRRPEKGTEPRLFYIGVDKSSLIPGEAVRSTAYLWAEAPQDHEVPAAPFDSTKPREVYNIGHEQAWGGLVSAYLWTKAIAAGAMLVTGLAMVGSLLGLSRLQSITSLAGPAISLLFLMATALLLVADLGHRERFYFILTRPNWRSWLVWGTWVLMFFALLCLAWAARVPFSKSPPPRLLGWVAIGGSILVTGYSALLFAQARARDWWQSPAVLPALLLQSLTAGAAAHWIVAMLAGFPISVLTPLLQLMAMGAGAALLVSVLELILPHVSKEMSTVAQMILSGRFARRFWLGGALCGALIPMSLVLFALHTESYAAAQLAGTAAAAMALAGVLLHEDIWVRAGQASPLS